MNDMVNQPNHYMKNGVECIDVIKLMVADRVGFEAVCIANCVKYLYRLGHKDSYEQDLSKAIKYLEMLKEDKCNG